MGKWTSVRADGQATTITVARAAAAVASYQMLSQLWIKKHKKIIIIRNVTNNR